MNPLDHDRFDDSPAETAPATCHDMRVFLASAAGDGYVGLATDFSPTARAAFSHSVTCVSCSDALQDAWDHARDRGLFPDADDLLPPQPAALLQSEEEESEDEDGIESGKAPHDEGPFHVCWPDRLVVWDREAIIRRNYHDLPDPALADHARRAAAYAFYVWSCRWSLEAADVRTIPIRDYPVEMDVIEPLRIVDDVGSTRLRGVLRAADSELADREIFVTIRHPDTEGVGLMWRTMPSVTDDGVEMVLDEPAPDGVAASIPADAIDLDMGPVLARVRRPAVSRRCRRFEDVEEAVLRMAAGADDFERRFVLAYVYLASPPAGLGPTGEIAAMALRRWARWRRLHGDRDSGRGALIHCARDEIRWACRFVPGLAPWCPPPSDSLAPARIPRGIPRILHRVAAETFLGIEQARADTPDGRLLQTYRQLVQEGEEPAPETLGGWIWPREPHRGEAVFREVTTACTERLRALAPALPLATVAE